MIIKSVRGKSPKIGNDCFIAENAVIVGEVSMGDQCSIWYSTVLRGDVHYIKMGNKVNVQDGAVIHCTYQKSPTTIGNNVSIGHNALVHGCTIKDNVLVGMGSIIMDDCVIESNTIIAAGAVVTKNILPYALVVGNPSKQIGWVSKYGHRLEFDMNGLAICIENNEQYLLKKGKVELKF